MELDIGDIVVIVLGLAVAVVQARLKTLAEGIAGDRDCVGGLGCLPEIQILLVVLFFVAASWFWGVAGFLLAVACVAALFCMK